MSATKTKVTSPKSRKRINPSFLSNKKLISSYASLSDVGVKRQQNQDSWTVFPNGQDSLQQPKGQLFLVADGMGGHARGDEASKIAVHYIKEIYFSYPSENITECLQKAFETANTKILQCWQNSPNQERMGTTCSALVLTNQRAYFAHVGDSRIYRLTRYSIEQITEDHTAVAELKKRGMLTESEAKSSPMRSELIRALGTSEKVEVDVEPGATLHPGDSFLLCTDGLEQVSEDEIKLTIQNNEPEKACELLVELEKERSGSDNITVQVVQLERDNITPTQIAHSDEIAHRNLKYGISFLFILVSIFAASQFRIPDLKKISNLIFKEKPDSNDQMIANSNIDGVFKQPVLEDDFEESFIDELSEELKRQKDIKKESNNEPMQLLTQPPPVEKPPENQPGVDLPKPELKPELKPVPKPAPVTPTPGPTTIARRARRGPAKRSKPLTVAPTMQGWSFPGLVENHDYVKSTAGFSMLPTVGLKKAIHNQVFNNVEFEVNFDDIDKLNQGQVGAFVGYRREGNNEYYYHVYLKQDGNFALVKNYENKRELLRPLDIQLNRINSGNLRLKVRCSGSWIVVYANDHLVNAWQNDNDFIKGRVGFFAGSEKKVKFSNVKVSKTTAIQHVSK